MDKFWIALGIEKIDNEAEDKFTDVLGVFDTQEAANSAGSTWSADNEWRDYEVEGPFSLNESTLDLGDDQEEPSDNMTDSEADADVLASAGMGTDEDYGYFGGNDE